MLTKARMETITKILERLRPVLLEFSVSFEIIKKELEDNDDLCITLNKLFYTNLSLPEEVEKWILMPFKIYNDSFVGEVLSKVSEDTKTIPNTSFSSAFVEKMILAKYRIYQRNHEKMVDSSVFSEDYLERLAFMMISLSGIEGVTELYERYYLDHCEALEYVTMQFPCAEFVKSLHFEGNAIDFMREHYDLLLNSNIKFLDQFVKKNIEYHEAKLPTFGVSSIEKIVPPYQTESHISCENFRQLLNFLLRNEALVDAKVELFPLLKSFYEDEHFYNCDVDFFLQRLSAAPDSFFFFLADQTDVEQNFSLFSDEIRNPIHLFSNLSAVSSEKREDVYPFLITPNYLSLSSDKRKELLRYMNFYNLETIQCLGEEFNNVLIDFDLIDDLHFNKFLSFLASDNTREFHHKMVAIRAVSHQLNAKHFKDYLSYLEHSHLSKKSEYKAHSAYFKNHSIDQFFDSFVLESWKGDVLHTKMNDKSKKKQQLRLVEKCPTSRLESQNLYKYIARTLEYSNDKEQIKNLVNLVINPLFDELPDEKKEELLSALTIDVATTTLNKKNDSVDIFIPNPEVYCEQLPEKGFVKCKGRGKNGPVEVFIGRSQK